IENENIKKWIIIKLKKSMDLNIDIDEYPKYLNILNMFNELLDEKIVPKYVNLINNAIKNPKNLNLVFKELLAYNSQMHEVKDEIKVKLSIAWMEIVHSLKKCLNNSFKYNLNLLIDTIQHLFTENLEIHSFADSIASQLIKNVNFATEKSKLTEILSIWKKKNNDPKFRSTNPNWHLSIHSLEKIIAEYSRDQIKKLLYDQNYSGMAKLDIGVFRNNLHQSIIYSKLGITIFAEEAKNLLNKQRNFEKFYYKPLFYLVALHDVSTDLIKVINEEILPDQRRESHIENMTLLMMLFKGIANQNPINFTINPFLLKNEAVKIFEQFLSEQWIEKDDVIKIVNNSQWQHSNILLTILKETFYCLYCNRELEKEMLICPNCGKTREEPEAAPEFDFGSIMNLEALEQQYTKQSESENVSAPSSFNLNPDEFDFGT
ncbi:MAG: hypothetical protein ACXAC7_21595, partial [Candidatus Hodarchaeales archaeon]